MAITDEDIFVCDYCGDDTGKFNADTGNHCTCEEVAQLKSELAALRRAASAARKYWGLSYCAKSADGYNADVELFTALSELPK